MQESFPSVLPKRVFLVSLQMQNKPAQKKPAKHKNTSPGKSSRGTLIVLSEKKHLEAKKRHSGVRKRLTAH